MAWLSYTADIHGLVAMHSGIHGLVGTASAIYSLPLFPPQVMTHKMTYHKNAYQVYFTSCTVEVTVEVGTPKGKLK